MAGTVSHSLWHELDGAECASVLTATCDRLERVTASRIDRAKRNLSLFEGRRIATLSPDAYYSMTEVQGESFERQRVPIARSIPNSAVAKVGGKQRPKTQFCVSGADWSTKRRAKRLERVVEATMLQRHTNHSDAWSVGLLCLRDAAVLDCGVIKWSVDWINRKVVCQRVLPWELIVDPYEAKYGAPRNIFHVYAYDRFQLAAQFPKFEEQIMAAPAMEQEPHGEAYDFQLIDRARLVKVREAWRLPTGKEGVEGYKPGRHALVAGNVDLLEGEEWTRDFFPFEIMTWEPWFMGVFGSSVVDTVAPMQEELSASVERWAAAERLGSNAFLVCEEDSVPKEALESNVPFTIVPVRKSAAFPPQVVVPETQGQASMAWREWLKANAYETSGQSQMNASGQTQSGVTAAVAMRTQDNIATERFSWQWRMFETTMTVGNARQIVACLRELAEEEGDDFTVRWPGGSYLREIKWKDADLENDQYVIQPYAVSGLVNTPTDRLNLASDLFDKGIISAESFKRVIQYKDVDQEIESGSKQSELLEQMIEQWLDADVDRLEDRDPDYIDEIYWPPEPFMNLPGAMAQIGDAYFGARLERAPDCILELFTRFLTELDAQIQKQAAQQAQIKALATGSAAANQSMGAPAAPPTPGVPPVGAMPNG